MSPILSLLFIVYATILQSTEADYPCRWKTANSTFDLCEMQLSSATENTDGRAYYEVFDNRASAFFNFTYIFNVCNDIESRPPDEICWNNTLRARPDKMMPTGYCAEWNETNGNGECIDIEDIIDNTAAYQVHRGMDTEARVHDCYRMHNGIDAPLFSYLDPDDPSLGVRITYINGDYCAAAQRNREFSLEFYCSEILENIPDKKEEIIYEDETCSYVLQVYTSYGCPTQCPISTSTNKLCDGHGVCEYDYTNNFPKCYCYYGYCGVDCSETGDACSADTQQLYNISTPNDDETCLFALSDSFGMKSYYNLSYFNLKGENFQVDDTLDREYVYKFNICGDMELFHDEKEVPASCSNFNHGPCTHFTERNYEYDNITSTTRYCDNTYDTFDSGSVAKAVQIYYPKNNRSEPMCYWLGMDLPDGFDMISYEVALIDHNDTGRGVIFKMMNGQYCDEGERNRELNVILRCPDTRGWIFDPYVEAKTILNESIFESDTCVYELEFESPLACPMNCISRGTGKEAKEFSVCSSHGICASDPEAKQIRCLCDHGYTGIVCQLPVRFSTTSVSTSSGGGKSGGGGGNGLSIGLGIAVSLLVLIVAGAFFYLQRKKRIAVGQYGNLQGDSGLISDDIGAGTIN